MDEKRIYVFSYGSNTFFNRIKARVHSVEVVAAYQLRGFRLVFNKKSTVDGSIKANILETNDPEDSVWGVIHRLAPEDKPVLDRYEGLGKGYGLSSLVLPVEGRNRPVYAYIATDPRYLERGKPFRWYLDFVIRGALENGFPAAYIERLTSLESIDDPDNERREKHQRLLARD